MKLGIIKEINNFHNDYIQACKDLNIDYEIIDITSKDWIENIRKFDGSGFLVRPSPGKAVWKQMYDEKLYFINKIMGHPIYPSYNELFIYENKRNMAYWLESNDIPMAKTYVFYNKKEAVNFVENYEKYPLFFKPNIGSGSLGIKILKKKKEALKLIDKIFTKYKFYNRGFTKWQKKYLIPYPLMDDKQFNNLIFQEKINLKYEWRGVKIGESYFAHKKLPNSKGLHSGSGKANYDTPPNNVMDFLKFVCDIGDFNSMNVDFFEDNEGNFYVNELQTIFGSNIKPYQMCVNAKPGRYLYINGKWEFEEGMFNQNNSWNLRVLDFINQLKK